MALGLSEAVAQLLSDLGHGVMYDQANPTIFIDEEPNTPDACITVIEEAGSPPTNTVLENRSFSIRVRAPTMEASKSLANSILTSLQFFQGVVNTIRFVVIEANFNPASLGRDGGGSLGGRYRYTSTYNAVTRRVTFT